MAASIETGIGNESGSISVSMLKENLDKVLPLMADILRRPVFDQEKIDLAKIEAAQRPFRGATTTSARSPTANSTS